MLVIVLLLIFGPKRLPEIGRSMGKGMREFKDSVTGKDDDEPAELTTTPVQVTPPVQATTPVQEPTPTAPATTPVERDQSATGS